MNSLSCVWIQNAGSNSSYYVIKVNLLTFPENKARWPGWKHGTGGVAGQGREGDEIKARLQPACARTGRKKEMTNICFWCFCATLWNQSVNSAEIPAVRGAERTFRIHFKSIFKSALTPKKHQWEMTWIVLHPRLGNTVEKVIFILSRIGCAQQRGQRGHQDDLRDGALLWGKAERIGVLQPGKK